MTVYKNRGELCAGKAPMRFFALRLMPGDPTIHATAPDRAAALSEFAKMIGHELTDQPTGRMAEYTLDEWNEGGAHRVNPHISIWKKR